jgi:hypothetical protein
MLYVPILALALLQAADNVTSLDIGGVLDAIRLYGLPLVMLVLMVALNLRGVYIAGREKVEQAGAYEKLLAAEREQQGKLLAIAEARRLEEREARLSSDKRLEALAPLLRDVITIVTQVQAELNARASSHREGR